MAVSVFQLHFGKLGPSPIRMIYTSSGPNFLRDSESKFQNWKFHQWHLLQPYLTFDHNTEKFNLNQRGQFIYHADHMFNEALNLNSEMSDSHCSHLHVAYFDWTCIMIFHVFFHAISVDPTIKIKYQTHRRHIYICGSHFRRVYLECFFTTDNTVETTTIYRYTL